MWGVYSSTPLKDHINIIGTPQAAVPGPNPTPARACIVFLIHLLSHAAASGVRLPPMRQHPDLLSTTPEHYDSQQTIYNLQPARNVFYKKRKPEAQPDPDHLRILSTRTRPKPAGPVGFVGPGRPVENSRTEYLCHRFQLIIQIQDQICYFSTTDSAMGLSIYSTGRSLIFQINGF